MKKIIGLLLFSLLFTHLLFGANGTGPGAKKGTRPPAKIAGAPTQTIMDINNITSWTRDDGFFDAAVQGSWNGTFPKGTIGSIFQEGIVWGGFVHDGQSPDLRVGGSTYKTGLTAGAILKDASGKVTGAEDPNAADVRIWRVRPDYKTADLHDDAANFFQVPLSQVTDDQVSQIFAQYQTDAAEWPVAKGAPFFDKDSDGTYNPDVDVPGIPGADQTIWYVSNDLTGSATAYGSPAIGLEMQMTMWGYSSELFSNLTFKRVRLIYKGTPTTAPNATISDMFITQWADPDLGDYSDDLAGCDTTLSLGYVYNGSAQDAFYRDRFGLPPPAVGYNFLQGVKVPGAPTDTAIFDFKYLPGFKNIPMTTFGYFAAGSAIQDPDLSKYAGSLQWYNLMKGCLPRPEYPSCSPYTTNTGEVTRFELSGDPITGTGDVDGRLLGPGDRRILLCTGPFNMALGDTQEVVVALVGGLGGDNLSSVSILKNNNRFAKIAFQSLFKSLPGAPPPPIVKVNQLNNEIVLNWGTDTASVRQIEEVNRQGWKFEGYNVYQLPSSSVATDFPNGATRVATFDVVDSVRTILNRAFDPVAKVFLLKPREVGTDNGVQRFIDITKDNVLGRPLVNGQTYYFAVTAYSYNPDSTVDFHALESTVQVLAVVPQSSKPGIRLGERAGSTINMADTSVHVSGKSEVTPTVTILDPSALTGDIYTMTFADSGGQLVWNLRDSTRGTLVTRSANLGPNISGNPNDLAAFPMVDGMLVQVVEEIPALKDDETQWVSDHPAWFRGDRFTADPAAAFRGGVTTGQQLGDFYLGHVGTTFNHFNSFPVDVKFGTPQHAYRLRRTGAGSSYLVQPTNPYPELPFSAWDVSDTAHPRQLTMAWRDQDDDGTWNPTTSDDGTEIVFIYNDTYDPTGATPFHLPPGAVDDEPTSSDISDIVYGLSLRLLTGHTLNESPGTLTIVPVLHLTPNDKFVFRPAKADTSVARAQEDVGQINVFPNPYYGLNAAETDRLQKYVTFNHLPQRATIRIFNLAGNIVHVIDKDDQSQFVRWNLRNDNNLPVASGIYIVHIDMGDPISRTKVLKLALVQEEQILRTY